VAGSGLVTLLLIGCQSSPPRAPEGAAEAAETQSAEAQPALGGIATLELSNPSSFRRNQSPVYLSYRDLGLAQAPAGESHLELRAGRAAIPLQSIDRDGDGAKDGVLALVDFAAEETRKFQVALTRGPAQAPPSVMAQAELSVKQGGQWQQRQNNPELKEYVGGTFTHVRRSRRPPSTPITRT
jgi:hypothetical protein